MTCHKDTDIAYVSCRCGRRMLPGDYLCPSCRQATARMRIVAKARFKPRRNDGEHNLCERCVMLEECRDCARDGRLLACEAADERDVRGTRRMA